MSTSCDSVLPSLRPMCHKLPNAHLASPGRTPGLRRDFSEIVPNRCAAAAMDQSVRFGGTFRFDIATGRLWSGDGEVRLTPKAAAVLKELVTHAGAPVSKEEPLRHGLERRRRQRRCADLVRAGAASSAEGRSQAAAVHRDPAPARLSDSWPR